MYCHHCGKPLDPNASVCVNCGVSVISNAAAPVSAPKQNSTKFCKNCGSPMDPNASVCVRCGCVAGAGTAFCSNCGKPLDSNASICVHCGYAVSGAAPKAHYDTGVYCRHCGSSMNPNAAICVRCGCAAGTGNAFCPVCGRSTPPGAVVCVGCGSSLTASTHSSKSRSTAGLLGIFLGTWGVHDFYLGNIIKAIIHICLSAFGLILGLVFTFSFYEEFTVFYLLFFGSAIWGLVDGILLLCGKTTKDASGAKLKD